MKGLKRSQDAFGRALMDHHQGRAPLVAIEREDGYLDGERLRGYFAGSEQWSPLERRAIRLARGRVLDVGCGAGRVALYLQRHGLDVTGIDISPLAVHVCHRRGVKNARVMSITEVSRRLGVFDTIVMFGNNFGLFGSFRRARWLLRRFRAMTATDARMIVTTNDVYATTNPVHLAYQRGNRRRGRMSGQIRFRIRYLQYRTPYMDYLMVSKKEMGRIVAGTGWRIDRFLSAKGSVYVAVLEKENV